MHGNIQFKKRVASSEHVKLSSSRRERSSRSVQGKMLSHAVEIAAVYELTARLRFDCTLEKLDLKYIICT